MPLYEYKCPSCGTEEEVMQKHTDPAPVCLKCSKGNPHDPDNDVFMVKQISKTSFSLKGSGWYRDGYSKKK